VFEQSPEDEALLHWQVREFLKAEELLADAWRLTSRAIDLEALQRMLRSNNAAGINIRSLDEAATVADNVLRSAPPSHLLRWFLNDCEIQPNSLSDPFSRFDDRGPFFMHAVVPYTVHATRANLSFQSRV